MSNSDLQFGESQKLRLVRILRSTVMVRVGGGWVALDEFLLKNDPCRGESLPISKLKISSKCRIKQYTKTDLLTMLCPLLLRKTSD